ncbi:ATP-binding SpoIIE family protein phosphatase [Candidatus Amarolinea aalborgensis]|uniref:ATP-binding SpoIIE family protein phosphatase n=1 Tax=Candidatus Amarolinea aalborgensis TaxID=2249329 RepID=UPI003BF9E68A
MRNPFRKQPQVAAAQPVPVVEAPASPIPAAAQILPLDFAPNDPLSPYLLSARGAVDLERVKLDSPALRALREAGVRLIAPLTGQGELIGLLNLGPRRSEQEYTADDRQLLSDLATQAAPAVRVAQLVRQQQIETRARERLEQELRVARVVQETLLPKELPELAGWQVGAYWQPAQAVSGDFYDFIALPDGNLGIVEADVTGKGVPAALVMAAARGILRVAAEQDPTLPGKVLAHVNDLLFPDIPPSMFVTCLYGVLNPTTGRFVFANAGHNLPTQRAADTVLELRATGMPLGLMPDMTYDEHEAMLAPGEMILIYSDGLVEAHNPQGEMFGFPRLRTLAGSAGSGADLIEHLCGALADFTGPGWEQEDDVTFVTLERVHPPRTPELVRESGVRGEMLADFTVASAADNEREAMERVATAVSGLDLPADRLERLKTAVGEATMNAMEHGNRYDPNLPVAIQVQTSADELIVSITDHGGGQPIPQAAAPDLEAKLAGLQSPRGWGLFLIRSMVDDMRVTADDGVHHTVELVMKLEESRR